MATRWKCFLPTAITIALQLFFTTPCSAASFATNSYADTFAATGATGNLVNSNYGAGGALSVAAAALPQGQFQSVLRFDLAGARNFFDSLYGSSQWTIQSATLRLTAASPNNAIFNASGAGQFGLSWMQNKSWTEGTGTPGGPSATGLTFNGLTNSFLSGADQGLGTFSFAGGTSGANTYTLTLSPSFASDILAGNFVGLRLFAADSSVSYLFNSREFGTAANRPLLTIDAVPEPSTIVFGGLGVMLFAARRILARRKCA